MSSRTRAAGKEERAKGTKQCVFQLFKPSKGPSGGSLISSGPSKVGDNPSDVSTSSFFSCAFAREEDDEDDAMASEDGGAGPSTARQGQVLRSSGWIS